MEIVFPEDRDGTSQVTQFIELEPTKSGVYIIKKLGYIGQKTYGENMRSEDIKKLHKSGDPNLHEIRMKYASKLYRILGFVPNIFQFFGVHIFQKDQEETPKTEIDKALNKKYLLDQYNESKST